MMVVESILNALIALAITLVVPPLMDGYSRKLKASLQYREGPPLLQSWYDLASLFKTPPALPTRSLSFTLSPCVALVASVVAALVLPFGTLSAVSFSWDVFVFIYTLAMVSVSMIIAGFSVNNPYANVGANREMMLILTTEPILGAVLAILALNSSSLSMYGLTRALSLKPSLLLAIPLLLYVAYVESGFIPFDVAEAETEILEGPLVEYSGVLLGLFKYALMIKRFVMLWFASSVLTSPIVRLLSKYSLPTAAYYLTVLATQFVIYFLLHTFFTVIEASSARYRVGDAMKLNAKVFIAGLVVLVLTAIGW